MIKIKTAGKQVEPVEIGSVTFDFDTSDENIKRIEKLAKDFSQDNNISEDEDIQTMIDFTRGFVDKIFGEGIFNKLYADTPSFSDVLGYTFQVLEAVGIRRNERSKLNKYLDKANAKAQ
ncbi:hypothetical protein ACUIJP_04600 [Leuconostoc pseudomesenteroides]|uniref:hypothetical protein n=1 Tax=Leuconostoc pseudomesenteroides TaxID=33968 RepID=UPI00403DA44B